LSDFFSIYGVAESNLKKLPSTWRIVVLANYLLDLADMLNHNKNYERAECKNCYS